jgi:hypothetical protein
MKSSTWVCGTVQALARSAAVFRGMLKHSLPIRNAMPGRHRLALVDAGLLAFLFQDGLVPFIGTLVHPWIVFAASGAIVVVICWVAPHI